HSLNEEPTMRVPFGSRRSIGVLVAAGLTCGAVLSSAQPEEPQPGQVAYDRVCKACHGPSGIGNAGPALVPFEMEVEELIAKVREGGGEMPPISENRLSDDEVKQIAAYLTSLSAH